MKNPWKNLYKDNRYKAVADCDDIKVLEIYNSSRKNKDEILRLDLPTTNVIGNIDTCKLMILLLNPGYSEGDYEDTSSKEFLEALYNRNDFWVLDNKFRETNTYKWWNQKLAKPVINHFKDLDEEEIRKRLISSVCCVEYFPYHSKSFNNDLYAIKLPSQDYVFEGLKEAITRNIPIILAKGKLEFWAYQVNEIYNYTSIFKTSSTQNSTLSENNLLHKNIEHSNWIKIKSFDVIYNFMLQ